MKNSFSVFVTENHEGNANSVGHNYDALSLVEWAPQVLRCTHAFAAFHFIRFESAIQRTTRAEKDGIRGARARNKQTNKKCSLFFMRIHLYIYVVASTSGHFTNDFCICCNSPEMRMSQIWGRKKANVKKYWGLYLCVQCVHCTISARKPNYAADKLRAKRPLRHPHSQPNWMEISKRR